VVFVGRSASARQEATALARGCLRRKARRTGVSGFSKDHGISITVLPLVKAADKVQPQVRFRYSARGDYRN